jgi:hypothetical protein
MKVRLLVLSVAVFALFATFSVSPRHAQVTKKMEMRDAFVEEGSPVQLVAVGHSTDFLLKEAEVTNTSDRTVFSVTFGTIIYENTPVPNEPILISSREIPTNLKSGQTRTLLILGAATKEVQRKAASFKSNSIIVESGVISVEFDDGGSWNFDPRKTGSFGPVSALPPASISPASPSVQPGGPHVDFTCGAFEVVFRLLAGH